jgi:hypothetical protein
MGAAPSRRWTVQFVQGVDHLLLGRAGPLIGAQDQADHFFGAFGVDAQPAKLA